MRYQILNINSKIRIPLFGFLLATFGLNAQDTSKLVTISVEYNNDQEPTFYSYNRTKIPYALVLSFTSVRNTIQPSPSPYLYTAKPGKKKILTLARSGATTGNVTYQFTWSYSRGCHKTKVKDDIEYLLPIRENKTTKISNYYYVGEVVNQEGPEDFYVLGFSLNHLDTVFAARRGIISTIVDEYEQTGPDKFYSKEKNLVQVLHDDCTFGFYSNLKKGSFLVKEGDKVNAGDPIALLDSKNKPKNGKLAFMVLYTNPDFLRGNSTNARRYVIPKFRTLKEKSIQLELGKDYTSFHPSDIITQEMSRRERKRWNKKNQ